MTSELTPGSTRPLWCGSLNDFITAVAWSADGELVAVASLSGEVLVLTASGELRAELPEHPFGALSLDWSPSGCDLAVGGHDGVLRIWSSAVDNVSIDAGSWVAAVAWSPDGAWLGAAAGRDVLVISPGAIDINRFPDQPSTLTAVAWSPNSRRIGVACYGGPRWFEPARTTDEPASIFTWKGSLLSLAIAPSGKWVASGNQDNSVHVWRLWSGDDFQMSGYAAKIEAISWDASSRLLAVGSVGDVTVWDFSGKGPQGTVPRELRGFERRVTKVAFQRRGPLLAAGSADGLLALWEPLRSTRPSDVIAFGIEISALAWSPDDTRVLVGCANGRLALVPVA